jgi:hypothetical protein
MNEFNTAGIVRRSQRWENGAMWYRACVEPNRAGLELTPDGVVAIESLIRSAIAWAAGTSDENTAAFRGISVVNEAQREWVIAKFKEIVARPRMVQMIREGVLQRSALTPEGRAELAEQRSTQEVERRE